MSKRRHPKGSGSHGGEFASDSKPRGDQPLSDTLHQHADTANSHPHDDLNQMVTSTSSSVRARAATDLRLTEAQAVQLAHDESPYVRWAVMRAVPGPQVIDVIRNDNDPFIRAIAAAEGLLDNDRLHPAELRLKSAIQT